MTCGSSIATASNNSTTQKYDDGLYICRLILQRIIIQLNHKHNNNTAISLLLLNALPHQTSIVLPLFLSYIRNHSLTIVTLVTVHPWLLLCNVSNSKNITTLCVHADAVHLIHGFALQCVRSSAKEIVDKDSLSFTKPTNSKSET